ncbi:MAG: GIY-YIG nuclease family protein [Candidatus Falkowbacteria bacterium]
MSTTKSHPLKERLKEVPNKPGVYFWLDQAGIVLYVGRATNLKNRLSQYFQKNIEARIAEMVATAKDLRWLVCDSLLEAIILEAKNIKDYWPKYNVVDRDNRSFIYIVIPGGNYPKPIIVRGQDLKKFPETKAKIFGPYQSRTLISNALRLIRPIFPWGNCVAESGKACFDYQIGLCPGACIKAITKTAYKKNIDNLCLLLSGDRTRLLKKLSQENPGQAKALKHLQDVSLLAREDNLNTKKLNRIEGYDISHLNGQESYGSMVVFLNGEADKNEYRLFKIKEAPAADDERALAEVLLRRFKHLEWPLPNLIMIDGGLPQISFLTKVLHRHNINTPLVGISKLGGDKLVFVKGTKENFKDLAKNLKPTLLKLREEAHRFANYGRKKGTWNLK